jgi:hypothetical protein
LGPQDRGCENESRQNLVTRYDILTAGDSQKLAAEAEKRLRKNSED